jgi:hypothetical protein
MLELRPAYIRETHFAAAAVPAESANESRRWTQIHRAIIKYRAEAERRIAHCGYLPVEKDLRFPEMGTHREWRSFVPVNLTGISRHLSIKMNESHESQNRRAANRQARLRPGQSAAGRQPSLCPRGET